MGRVRPGKHSKSPKPPQQPPSPAIDPQVHRLSSSLAAPPSSNLSPHSEADLALFRPSQETVNWLYSLPLPPGVTQQPLPETNEDWALVEKFRWLCQGLVLAGEYERERRRRIERGEDPYSEWEEWDPRQSGNPLVASAVQSLMNSHAPTHPHPSYALSHPLPPHYTHPHPQYAIGNHPQYPSYPADFQPQGYDSLPTHFGGVPIDYGFAGDDEEDEYEDEPYSDRGGEEEEREEEIVSEHTYDFPTLETLQSFAASGAVAPLPLDHSSSSSSLPLSLDLSALTSSLGPNGLGELAAAAGVSVEGLSAAMNGQLGSLAAGAGEGGVGGEGGEGGTNPASLPSLIAAIAELEQCVARLSLEATEARNLQKSLRDEMSTRTTPSTSTSTSSNAPAGKAEAVAATLARAGLRPMKRKVKGGRVVSVSSRSRLPPPSTVAVKPAAAPPPPVASAPATNGHAHNSPHHHHHHCSDCGESLSSHSAHASPSPSAPPSRPSSPPPHPAAPPLPQSLPPTAPPSAPLPPSVNGQQGQQWEDGELMKALQSVSMLDRRADEYRERLRVLKEQIHHHAALADALAAPGAASAAGAGAPATPAAAPSAEKKPFGQSVSDTTLELVAVSEYRHRQLSRLQAQSQSSSTSSTSPSSPSSAGQPPISIDPPAVPSALAPWVPPSGDYNTPMTSEELYTAMRAEREVLLRECSAAESEHGDAELALGAEDLAKQEAFEAYAEQLKKEFEEERTDPMEKSRKAQLVMDVWGRLRPEVQGRWRAEREERERRYYEERERRRKEREKEKVKGEEGKVGEGPEGGK